jgi:anti-sigma regulatory factor (Ser/Thr protein kinase)
LTGVLLAADLEPGPFAARDARELVAGLGPSVPRPVLLDAVLLVSELVTNSCRYGTGGPIRLKVVLSEDRLRVDVTDPGGGDAIPTLTEPPSPGAWGLRIVDRVATRWGAEAGPPTLVWFELLTAPADEDAPQG